jgi:hypothetical protein
MAIRYSGDTEIRLGWDGRKREYRGSVRDPYLRWRGKWKPKSRVTGGTRTDSSHYDEAARDLIHQAQFWAKQEGKSFRLETNHGRVMLRRVFQAPCPVGGITRRRHAPSKTTKKR